MHIPFNKLFMSSSREDFMLMLMFPNHYGLPSLLTL